MAPADLEAALAGFSPISLDDLEERAALLRRVDRKYAVERDEFLELIERLRRNHQLLVIEGRREFGYRSVYFDTPDLRCFVDHVDDRLPRFKTRTRLYEDSGVCVFEVKLKRADGEMDKRQVEHPPDRGHELTERALRCVADALADASLDRPERLEPTLVTTFTRITFAADRTPERLTCDLGIALSSPTGAGARIKGGTVVVESKSEHGESAADDALERVGAEEVSLSKYRVGMSLVGGAPVEESQPGSELFAVDGA